MKFAISAVQSGQIKVYLASKNYNMPRRYLTENRDSNPNYEENGYSLLLKKKI